MKKFTLLLITILFFLTPATALALTPTPTLPKHTTLTPSPSSSTTPGLEDKLKDQIDQLKTKIASRVAELNLVEKHGLIGTVAEVSGNQVTVTDTQGKTRFVDVDEITKFTSPGTKGSFGLSDLTKDKKITVLGLYNKQSKRILARFISTTVNPAIVSGNISAIDKKNYTLTVTMEEGKEQKVDVETATKISVYSKADGISRSGFSKLSNGDRVQIIGYPDKKDSTLLVADRIITFPDLPKNPKIVIKEPEPSDPVEIKSSTGSGKKLTPIKR